MSRDIKPKPARHVRLYHWFLKTEAWRDLDPSTRCAYIALVERYNGTNNGKIGCSLSDLAGSESHVDFGQFVATVAPMAANVVRRIIAVV